MSSDESSALDKMREAFTKWLIGCVASMLLGAVALGSWVATTAGHIATLQDNDRISVADRGEIRGQMKAQNEVINVLRQDTALQNLDLKYIKESVTKIERAITK